MLIRRVPLYPSTSALSLPCFGRRLPPVATGALTEANQLKSSTAMVHAIISRFTGFRGVRVCIAIEPPLRWSETLSHDVPKHCKPTSQFHMRLPVKVRICEVDLVPERFIAAGKRDIKRPQRDRHQVPNVELFIFPPDIPGTSRNITLNHRSPGDHEADVVFVGRSLGPRCRELRCQGAGLTG